MSLDPPESEWPNLQTVAAVATWVGLQGDSKDPDTVCGSLCHLLGTDGSAHPRSLALVSEDDFKALIAQWKVPMPTPTGGVRPAAPSVIQLGQGALLGRTCRVVSGVYKLSPPNPVAPPAAPSSSSDTRKVKLSSVINQSDDLEVAILDDAAIHQAYANYRKRIGALPPADQELSSEQLSSLHSLFSSGRAPYCDMAVWGPYHHRLQKKIRLKGVRLSSQGEIIPVEICGPADFESWRESYSVFRTGCIMFDQITPARLDAYEHLIRSYHERYGRSCWALLYQADVRARLEHTERLRRVGREEHQAAVDGGGSHSFEPKKPWEWVWEKLVLDQAFWHRELEEPALLILAKTQRISQAVDADAPVDVPTWGTQDRGGKGFVAPGPAKRRRQDGPRQHSVGDDGLLTHNRRGAELCRGFQKGECKEKDRNGFCIKNTRLRHQCAKCLSEEHGANVCPVESPRQPREFKPKGGKKGGKSRS